MKISFTLRIPLPFNKNPFGLIFKVVLGFGKLYQKVEQICDPDEYILHQEGHFENDPEMVYPESEEKEDYPNVIGFKIPTKKDN
ncbi:MAG: hypothetical protein AAFZ15_27560 [Bacteroidota bacterium]